jgi:hypothetical protein
MLTNRDAQNDMLPRVDAVERNTIENDSDR